MWFRCDACCATFFKVNKTLVERHGKSKPLTTLDFMELMEGICETMFTKHEFGVKQYEGHKYLFGPGVIDHIPDKGFGQMGMGDYDSRLAAYCRMFVEEVGEEELQRLFLRDGSIDRMQLCNEECLSPASGTSGRVTADRQPRKKTGPSESPPPPSPPTLRPPRKTARKKQNPPAPAPPLPAPTPPAPATISQKLSPRAATGSVDLEQMVAAVPSLSSLQLRWLGDAVLGELAQRANRLSNLPQDPEAASGSRGAEL